MVINLRRFLSDDRFTLGAIVFQKFSCFSLELPWKENRVNTSCIPIGRYKCSMVQSTKFGNVLLVHDVPGRSGILFHPGNDPADTQGCVLVGSRLDLQASLPLLNSKQTFNRFLNKISSEEEHELIITYPWQST